MDYREASRADRVTAAISLVVTPEQANDRMEHAARNAALGTKCECNDTVPQVCGKWLLLTCQICGLETLEWQGAA